MKDTETQQLVETRAILMQLAQQALCDPVLSNTVRRHLNGARKAIDQAINANAPNSVKSQTSNP